jgi:predicted RNase H-like HicB family nuclease
MIAHHPLENSMRIQIDREDDGRWIGEVPARPGVLVYASTENEARIKAEALAFRVIADRLEHGELVPAEVRGLFAA